MSEVALASGFGSVRRFNETFQQLFGRPPARCAAESRPSRPRRERRRHAAAPLPAAVRLGRDARLSEGARDPRRRGRVAATATRAPSRSAARTAWSRFGPAEGHDAERDRSGSRRCRRCRRSSPACAACSIWQPIRRRSARTWRGSGAGAAGGGAPGPARAGRLGRLRAGGARLLGQQITWPRRSARGQACRGLRRAARRRSTARRADPRFSPTPSGWRRPTADLGHAARPRRRAGSLAAAVAADPAIFRPAASSTRRSRSCARCTASASGPRSTSRCGSCASPMPSRRGHRAVAGHGRPEAAPADARRAARARRALAPLARLCRAAPVGVPGDEL